MIDGRRSHRWAVPAAVVAAAGTLVIGLAAWRVVPRTGAASAGDAGRARPLFPPGIEQVYRLEYGTEVTTTAGQPMTSFKLDGTLKLVGLTAAPTIQVRGEFNGSFAAETGTAGQEPASAPAPDAAALAAATQRAFFLEFAADGSFRGARGERGAPAFVGRLWSALGEYVQVMGGDPSGAWEIPESDASGKYVARYETPRAGVLEKKKVRYESAKVRLTARYEVVASGTEIRLDDRSALQALKLNETLKADLGGGPLPGFQAETTVDMRRTAAAPLGDRLAAWLEQMRFAVPVGDAAREENSRARDRAMIAGFDMAEALSRVKLFTNPNATKEEHQRAGRAFAALAALLRQDPAALAIVRANLAKPGPLTVTLLAALRDASTPEAQKLLAELLGPGSPLTGELRMEAARALSLVPTPTAETVETLKRLRSDAEVAAQATYGLGSVVHNAAGKDAEVAAAARTALVDQLAVAKKPGEQALALTALGNAGDASTLDTIKPFVTSAAPEVRAAAAQGLRQIEGADADGMLARLCADASANVRFSAVDAIGERAHTPALAAALSLVAIGEPEYQIRARAVNTLVRWSPTAPSVNEALAVVATRDSNADLRNVAGRALP